MRKCLRCGIDIGIWGSPYCKGRHLSACLDRMARMDPSPLEGPEIVWVDPYDLPPADLSVCTECKGKGEIKSGRRDYETGGYPTLECPRCDTTGFEPTYEPWSGLAQNLRYSAAIRRMGEPV